MAENTSMTLAGQEMPCEPGKREQMAVTWQPGDRAAWAEGLAAWQAEMGGGSAREYILWLIATSKRVRGDDELVRRLEAAGVDQIVAAHWQRRKAEDRLLEAIADAVAAARATAEQAVAAELAELREQCATLRTERDEMAATLQDAVAKGNEAIAKRDAELERAVKMLEEKTAYQEQTLKDLDLVRRGVEAVSTRVSDAEAKMAEAQADAVAAKAEAAQLQAELAEARAAVDSKDKALSTAMIDMAANRATAEAQAATITDLRATIETLRDALAAIGDKAQTAASNIPSLADLDKVQTLDELDDLVIEYERGRKHKSVIGVLASLLRGPRKPKAAETPAETDIFADAMAEIKRRKAEVIEQQRAKATPEPAPDPYPEGVEIDPVRDDPDPEPPATDGAPDLGPLSAADLFAADAGGGADDIPEPEFAPTPDPDPFGPPPDPFADEKPQNGPQEPRKGRGRRKG